MPSQANATFEELDRPAASPDTSVTNALHAGAQARSGVFGAHRQSLAAVIIVSALLLVGLAGVWRAPGQTMDEGIVLEYPELILHGQVPFRDFQSSYGPGTYVPLAVAYEVAGPSVTVERAVGVAYRLAVILALLALLWPLGAALAVAGACLATLAVLPFGSAQVPVAYGWHLALACVLWGLWSARAAMTSGRSRAVTALWGLAGLLVGAAVSARPDLVVAALLSSAVLVVGARPRSRLAFVTGLALGAVPLVWNIVAAGWSRFWSYGVEARLHQLPVSGYPFPRGAGLVLAVSAVTLVVFVAAILERRRRGANPLTRGWLALAVLAVLLLPQVFGRADSGHFAFVAPVSLALLPWAVLRGSTSSLTRVAIPALSAIAVALTAVAAYANAGFVVRNHGRSFAAPTAMDALALQKVVDWLDTHVAPHRTLFVGPADLRWAFYTPTEVYFLTPRLRPAGFYLEFGPGDDTPLFTRQLVADLNRADVLVLDSIPVSHWRQQIWPQARIGFAAPNAFVRREFRSAFRDGQYTIWLRR